MQGLFWLQAWKTPERTDKHYTKCMVKVNGVTMIERTLRILDKKHLSKIIIVVGYKGDNLIQYIKTLNNCNSNLFI